MHHVTIGPVTLGHDLPLVLIAGPCQLEGRDHARAICGSLQQTCAALGIGLIFKASFDKANRTSLNAPRGPGLDEGLRILSDIRAEHGLPVLTDVHEPAQCAPTAQAVDVLQIPAFLARQTDLLLAAGQTGAAIHVKKGQFMAPADMAHVVAKLESTGNRRILLCERGTFFGYGALVNDFRALPQMAAMGWPVVFDATHSVQQPGGLGGATGGQRDYVAPLARAAVAVGVAGLFIETHPDPDHAPSDGPNMVPLANMPALLRQLVALDRLVKGGA
jgi:2-dehydro-3-deoxyphosphooctonate aldolase (KDO 8-P synthase)